jgi:thiamine pyrophosphate-dependent acetolactate synthase large subunit-like protein
MATSGPGAIHLLNGLPGRPRDADRQGDRSVTWMIVPNDIQEAEYSEPPRAHGRTNAYSWSAA